MIKDISFIVLCIYAFLFHVHLNKSEKKGCYTNDFNDFFVDFINV